MLAIFTNPAYDFIGKRRWAYAVSVAVMLLGLASMFVKGGLQYDIDFTGGTLVELRLAQPLPLGEIRSRLTAAGLRDSIIQIFDDPRDVLIRTQLSPADPTELSRRIVSALDPSGTSAPEIRRVEFVGPQIGDELRKQAVYAVLAALGGILLYVWMRFDFRGGVVTIVSLAHDVLICLGALSLANREFSLTVLAALLTVIGFSVNDRIVMYDRLREIRSSNCDPDSLRPAGEPRGEPDPVANRADRRDDRHVGGDALLLRWRVSRKLRLRRSGGRADGHHVDRLRGGGPGRGLVALG